MYSVVFFEKNGGPKPEKSGSGRSWKIWTIIGVLLTLLALGVGLFFLSGGKQDLPSALARTGAALWGDREMPRAMEFGEKLEALLEERAYTMTLSSGDEFSLVTHYSQNNRILKGAMVSGGEKLAYSVDGESLQFAVPGKLEHVYGVKLGKLEQLLENPLFAAVFGGLFGDDPEMLIRNGVAEAVDGLCRSIQVQSLEDAEFNDQRCRSYRVTWSAEAARQLMDALGAFPVAGERIRGLIPDFGSECTCYVNRKGYIAGVEFIGDGVRCQFLLEGRKNPWDALTLKLQGQNLVYTGALERSGSTLRLVLENWEGMFLACSYDDATGDFALSTRSGGEVLAGRIRTQDGVGVALDFTVQGEPRQMDVTMAPLADTPAPLSEEYIDLLDMNLVDIARFLLDLGIS